MCTFDLLLFVFLNHFGCQSFLVEISDSIQIFHMEKHRFYQVFCCFHALIFVKVLFVCLFVLNFIFMIINNPLKIAINAFYQFRIFGKI